MWEHIEHEDYNGHDIRSNPMRTWSGWWTVRIDIAWPPVGVSQNVSEHRRYEELYVTLEHAHSAGFVLGRRLIDESILKQ